MSLCPSVLKISQTRNEHEAGSKQSLLHAGFLLGLLFNPEYGGSETADSFQPSARQYIPDFYRNKSSKFRLLFLHDDFDDFMKAMQPM
jgi:hypothetical protein